LEPRAVKCIFLGYKSGVNAYNLWNPDIRKVVISRNVVFNEHAMLQDNTIDFPVDGQQKSSVQVEQFVDAPRKEINSISGEPITKDFSIVENVPIVSQPPPPR